MDEVWKPVVGYETRYEVSSLGRVRALPRQHIMPGNRVIVTRFLLLKQDVGGRAKNYKRVQLHNPPRHAYVHHLMAEAFLGPRPAGVLVLHKDDVGFHNTIDNLRYGDRDENEADRHVARVAGEMDEAPF